MWSGVLGPLFDCGALCWDRYLSVERYVGADVACGAVCWDRNLSVWWCLGLIVECRALCWYG